MRLLPAFPFFAFAALLAGCASVIHEFQEFTIPPGSHRVLVVDRHGMYAGTSSGRSTGSVVFHTATIKPLDSAAARASAPQWLSDVDDHAFASVDQGLRDLKMSETFFEFIVDPAPLGPVFRIPREPVADRPWNDPLDPAEAVRIAAIHNADVVVALEWIRLSETDSTQGVSNQQTLASPTPGTSSIHDPENMALRVVSFTVHCGWRSYSGKTGQVTGELVTLVANGTSWQEPMTGPATPAATVELTKFMSASSNLLTHGMRMGKALKPSDVNIQ